MVDSIRRKIKKLKQKIMERPYDDSLEEETALNELFSMLIKGAPKGNIERVEKWLRENTNGSRLPRPVTFKME